MGPLIDLALAFAATWVGCLLLARALPLCRAPFGAYMTRRGLRMIGRTVIVLTVIGAGVGPLGAQPVAVVVGGLAAWLVAAGVEARRMAGAFSGGGPR